MKSLDEAGGPAFGQQQVICTYAGERFRGASMRDYFAKGAMLALLTKSGAPPGGIAERAYEFADAMLAERDG